MNAVQCDTQVGAIFPAPLGHIGAASAFAPDLTGYMRQQLSSLDRPERCAAYTRNERYFTIRRPRQQHHRITKLLFQMIDSVT